MVPPPSPRCLSVSRQAMMWARVTVRNSSGRTMPAKRTKSRTAVSNAPGAGVTEIGEPLDLGRHVGQPVELGGGQKPVAGRDPGRELVCDGVPRVVQGVPRPYFLFLIKSVIKN